MDIERIVEGPLKNWLVGLLIVLGVSVALFVFTPAPPDSVVTLDGTGDTIATIAATICGILCCPGLLCIFIKKLRFPMVIILAFVLLLFLAAVCIDHAYNNLNYALSKDKNPVERLCVITHHAHNQTTRTNQTHRTGKDVFGNENEYVTEHTETADTYEMKFRFLDGGVAGSEHAISRSEPYAFYNRVYQGDTCIAYILTGALGRDYVADMIVKKRAR